MANDFISSYFGFNRQQRNGLCVLLLISLVLLIIRIVYPLFISEGNIVIKDLPLIEAKLDSVNNFSAKTNSAFGYKKAMHVVLFNFDPNKVTLQQLLLLGFSEKKATTFLKFRSRGFVFKKKEDLQKVYGISEKLYASLEPFILIAPKSGNAQTVSDKNSLKPFKILPDKKPKIVLEINAADSSALEALNGIGPAFSVRIMKYRNTLGGFANIEQLREVYGIDEALFEQIKPFISVNPASIKKINLNKDDFKIINKHPYISYETTKKIFNLRRTKPVNASNLQEIMGDDVLYSKLLPYLIFD